MVTEPEHSPNLHPPEAALAHGRSRTYARHRRSGKLRSASDGGLLTGLHPSSLQPDSFNATVAANSATFPRPGTSDPTLVAGDNYWFR
jgi:hypothetical protein